MQKKIQNFIQKAGARMVMQMHNLDVYHFKVEQAAYDLITDGKIAIVVDSDQLNRYLRPKRTYIQDIFPQLTGMERQFIQSGHYFGRFDGNSFKNACAVLAERNQELVRILP